MTKGINAAYDEDAELELEGGLQSAPIIVPILLKLLVGRPSALASFLLVGSMLKCRQ